MTDQDENRPLSRRELRLREMAEAGLPTDEAQPGLGQSADDAPEIAEAEFHVEIPLLDESGNPRSRRELRELREQAIAEFKAANADEVTEPTRGSAEFATEPAEGFPFDPPAGSREISEPEQSAGEPTAAAAFDESSFDAILQQAASGVASSDERESLSDEPAESGPAAGVVDEVSEAIATEVETPAEPALEVDSEVGAGAGAEVDSEAVSEPESMFEAEEETELTLEAEAETQPEPAETEPELENVLEAADSSPVAAAVAQTYSFPDITPLDDGLSIFDDPASHVIGGTSTPADAGADTGSHGFDDLITRAVAQEGAASTTNTSALILPVMPETDALTGSLGETGELFITGSFDLPISLSETGGHASLHDPIDAETFDELGFVEPTPTGAMAPVSASRAVSARVNHGPLVAEATKDKNKMPVVLIAAGGVLVLGAAGLIVWAATSGLFG